MVAMTMTQLRRNIRKAIDNLPRQRLESLADYVRFLNRSTVKERIERAEEEFASGKGIAWRKVRRDV